MTCTDLKWRIVVVTLTHLRKSCTNEVEEFFFEKIFFFLSLGELDLAFKVGGFCDLSRMLLG
jgi:hypothetical protein